MAKEEPIEVFGRFASSRGPVVLSLMRGQTALANAVAEPNQEGYFSARLIAPEGVFGLATIRASEVAWNTRTAEISARSALASVYLVPDALEVSIDGGTAPY